MNKEKGVTAINERYSSLSDTSCCLSCGGALKLSSPMEGERCLDLGSGRGTDAMRMADAVGKGGHVYGIDISRGMLKKARRDAAKLGYDNVTFIESELKDLPIDENSIDLIISNCTLNHVQDKERIWKEIYRVLKKGGRFIVSDIYSVKSVPEEYRNDPHAVAECWAGSVTRDSYLDNLYQAGFSAVEILEESAPYEKGKIEVASWSIRGFKE